MFARKPVLVLCPFLFENQSFCVSVIVEPDQLILAISRWFALLRLISVKQFNIINNPFNTFKFVQGKGGRTGTD